jgi:hypothetical protein
MAGLRRFYRRLRALWRSEAIHDEITEEMRFHPNGRAQVGAVFLSACMRSNTHFS